MERSGDPVGFASERFWDGLADCASVLWQQVRATAGLLTPLFLVWYGICSRALSGVRPQQAEGGTACSPGGVLLQQQPLPPLVEQHVPPQQQDDSAEAERE